MECGIPQSYEQTNAVILSKCWNCKNFSTEIQNITYTHIRIRAAKLTRLVMQIHALHDDNDEKLASFMLCHKNTDTKYIKKRDKQLFGKIEGKY